MPEIAFDLVPTDPDDAVKKTCISYQEVLTDKTRAVVGKIYLRKAALREAFGTEFPQRLVVTVSVP